MAAIYHPHPPCLLPHAACPGQEWRRVQRGTGRSRAPRLGMQQRRDGMPRQAC